MKKVITTITLALAAANANALVNPNKVYVLSNGARVNLAQAEQIYDQQLRKWYQQFQSRGTRPTAWDWASTLAGEPCELAHHLISRLAEQSGGNSEVLDAFIDINTKCTMNPNGKYNVE